MDLIKFVSFFTDTIGAGKSVKPKKAKVPNPDKSRIGSSDSFIVNTPKNPNDGLTDHLSFRHNPDEQLSELTRRDGTVSQAVFQTVRAASTKWFLEVYDVKGQPHKKSKEITKKLTSLLMGNDISSTEYKWGSSFEILQQELIRLVIERGACATLVQLDDKFLPFNIMPIDSLRVKWKEVGYQNFKPYLDFQSTKCSYNFHTVFDSTENYMSLNMPNFSYARLDGDITDPYPISPLTPVLKVIFILSRLLESLQAVSDRVGWPRISVKVIEEKLENSVPPEFKDDDEKSAKWKKQEKEMLYSLLANIKPDQVLVTSDWVDTSILSTKDAGNKTLDPAPLLNYFSNLMAQGCKTFPALLGVTENVDPLVAFMQGRTIAGFVKPVEDVLSENLSFFLRMLGIRAYCKFKYERHTLKPESEMEQYRSLRIKNDLIMVAAGCMTPEQFSKRNSDSFLPNVGDALLEIANDVNILKQLIDAQKVPDPEKTAKNDTTKSVANPKEDDGRSDISSTVDKGLTPKSVEKDVKGKGKPKKPGS